MEVKVAVSVGSIAGQDGLPGLSPESGVGEGVFVAVGVNYRQNDPGEVGQQVLILTGVFRQLTDDVQSSSRGHPFTSVNSTIDENLLLVGVKVSVGDCDGLENSAFVGSTNCAHLGGSWESQGNVVQEGVDFMVAEVRVSDISGSQTEDIVDVFLGDNSILEEKLR
jgi:hypothetical protein